MEEITLNRHACVVNSSNNLISIGTDLEFIELRLD